MANWLRLLKIERAELRWVCLMAALVMLFTLLPYYFGLFITPEGMKFMGWIHNPDEHNVYLSWMRQAREGQLFFFDRFTTEPQAARFFNLFFLVLGFASRVTHLPLVVIYHLARLLFGFLLLAAIYALAARFTSNLITRRLAFWLTAFGSGLGWLWWLLNFPGGRRPVDFGPGLVMPEAITFLSLLLNPLFCFSVWLLITGLLLLLISFQLRSVKWAIWSGVVFLILGNVHSYDMFTAYGVVLVYLVVLGLTERRFPKAEIGLAALAGLLSLPSVAYQYLVFRTNPVFQEKALTLTLSPPLLDYFLSFGIPLLLAILGVVAIIRYRRKEQLFPVVWCIISFALVYLPVSFQRKLAEGLQVPICLLAALWVGDYLGGRLNRRGIAWAGLAAILLAVPSNGFFLAEAHQALITNNAAKAQFLMPPFYLYQEQLEGIHWLEEDSHPDQAVLCTPLIGSYIPGLSGNRVYVGHWAETLHYGQKLQIMHQFFRSETSHTGRMAELSRKALIKSEGLDYLFYGPYEQELGDFRPDQSPLMESVFRNRLVTIYRFK